MRFLLTTCFLLWNFSGVSVGAPDKDQVLRMLEGRHWKLDIRVFNKLGDDADIILIEIAKNDSLMNVIRFRALEVLSLFPTDKTASFLVISIKIMSASSPSLLNALISSFQ